MSSNVGRERRLVGMPHEPIPPAAQHVGIAVATRRFSVAGAGTPVLKGPAYLKRSHVNNRWPGNALESGGPIPELLTFLSFLAGFLSFATTNIH